MQRVRNTTSHALFDRCHDDHDGNVSADDSDKRLQLSHTPVSTCRRMHVERHNHNTALSAYTTDDKGCTAFATATVCPYGNRPRTNPPGSDEIAKRHAVPLRVWARAGACRTSMGVRRARTSPTSSPSKSWHAFPPLTLRSTREAGATTRRANGPEVDPENKSSEGGKGGGSFVACLSQLTIDHATLSRLAPFLLLIETDRDTSNFWALNTLSHIVQGGGEIKNKLTPLPGN